MRRRMHVEAMKSMWSVVDELVLENENLRKGQHLDEAEDLVRWLALTYGANDPIFDLSSPAQRQLVRTWYRIVRGVTVTIPQEIETPWQ